MSDARDRKRPALMAELDPNELTVRFLEIGLKLNRPHGKSAAELMQTTRRLVEDGKVPAYIVEDFEKMAVSAIEYLVERINALQRVQ